VSIDRGTVTSGASAIGCWMPLNSGGRTPTMVTSTSFILTVLPTTLASVPKRECQYFELITATGGAVGLSSSGPKVRPSRALMPSIWK
jgi:hypothetical protein